MIIDDNNCDYDCSSCDKCMYDEDYGAYSHSTKIEEPKKEKHFCNKCIYGSCINVESNGKIFTSWFCDNEKPSAVVAINVSADEDVQSPSWCDVLKQLTKQCKKSENMEETYWTKKERLTQLPHVLNWEDIEVGKVYHVPPVLDERRKDIFIKSVHATWIDYVEIKPDGKKSYNQETYYKSSLAVHFLVPSKIRQVTVVE